MQSNLKALNLKFQNSNLRVYENNLNCYKILNEIVIILSSASIATTFADHLPLHFLGKSMWFHTAMTSIVVSY